MEYKDFFFENLIKPHRLLQPDNTGVFLHGQRIKNYRD